MARSPDGFWFKAPLADAQTRLKRAAIKTKQPLSRVTFVWVHIQESAQRLNKGGEFALNQTDLAFADGVEEETIDAIVSAFKSEAVGLIVDGQCATFVPETLNRDQKLYLKKKKGEEAAGAVDLQSACADGSVCAQTASVCAQTASDSAQTRAESSDRSDSVESDDSSVVVPFAARESDDDDSILIGKIIKAFAGKVAPTVIRDGISDARCWIRDGCDLEADVLPELADIAGTLRKPLKYFGASWIAPRILARRDARLAREAAADGEFARAPPRGQSSGKNYELEALMEISANG